VSKPPIEPLPAEIASLLERERAAYPEDAAAKSAVFARVEMALVLTGAGPVAHGSGAPQAPGGNPAAGSSAAAVKGATVGKIVALAVASFVAGGVSGGAVVSRTLRPGAPQPSPVVTTPAATVNTATPGDPSATAAPPATPAATEAPAATALASATAPAPPRASSTTGDLTRERELLDVARAALERGRPKDAVAAAKQHAQKWPHGYLAEEREVVLIQALVADGDVREAQDRAAQFHRSFPRSMLGPAVDSAIRGSPSPP
jgi:TolA-binding protein